MLSFRRDFIASKYQKYLNNEIICLFFLSCKSLACRGILLVLLLQLRILGLPVFLCSCLIFFFQIKSTLPLLHTVFSFFLDNQRYGRFDHEDWCTHKVRVQSQCCFGGTDHKLSYNRQINIQSCSLFLVISLCPFNSLHLAHGTLTEE